ncbi:MAG: DUF4013 domain-containing protein [Chloroflexota bacterium]|nr:DUF4013 domain-containing protein [Chloroflexota bacterium]MXX50532.1 DUF4013 domain-containing protein [Chloroflexota bacterium]MYA91939.1 DUF4013 domain-containing protein [Chloroflexota bacterium]MYD38714.1 DUF4013 domain-containing protein [Chloroflexota bacterium]MYH66169.1 DUF4013 domain-containing protein [Chloroflexota bacterium]
MTVVRAFTTIFSDRNWLRKLTEMAVFVLLLPFPVIGLISLCALLGYLAKIIHNISADYESPLPDWEHIGEDISKGIPVFLALLVYHLPLLLTVALLAVLRGSLALGLSAGIDSIAPFALALYSLLAWMLWALGLVRYAETWESASFYQFDQNLRALQSNFSLALTWLGSALIANLLLLALLPVFLLGALLFVPVQGYVAGVYARRLRVARLAERREQAHAAANFVPSRSAEGVV